MGLSDAVPVKPEDIGLQPEPTAYKPSWSKPLGDAARHGLVGRVLDVLEPHSEADPVALLVNFLVVFGNATGTRPHMMVGGGKHPPRLFVALVGESSKGRKGMRLFRRWLDSQPEVDDVGALLID